MVVLLSFFMILITLEGAQKICQVEKYDKIT